MQERDVTAIRTVVGVFDDASAVRQAVDGLMTAGFPSEAISVAARGTQEEGGAQVNEGRTLVTVTATDEAARQRATEAFRAANALSIQDQALGAEPSAATMQEAQTELNAAAQGRATTDAFNNPANDQPLRAPLGQNAGGLSAAAQGVVPPLATHSTMDDPMQRERARRNTYVSDNAGGNDPAGGDRDFDVETSPDILPSDTTSVVDEIHEPHSVGDELNRFGAGSDRVQ